MDGIALLAPVAIFLMAGGLAIDAPRRVNACVAWLCRVASPSRWLSRVEGNARNGTV
jgi:hypothetical protein